MFILTEICDKVEISAASIDKNAEILTKFDKKYANKHMKTLGLGICVHSLRKIHHYRVRNELIMAKVDLFVLVFKLYDNELLCGKITTQSDSGVAMEVGFYGQIFVPKKNMLREFEVASNSTSSVRIFYWFWRYKEHKLYFINGETARFKIKAADNVTEGRIDEAGLGPTNWWE